MIRSLAGIVVFLAFTLFATQLLADLHARSVLNSAAHEAARSVAGASSPHDDPRERSAAEARAADQLRRRLGDHGPSVRLDWSGSDVSQVALRASMEAPRILPPVLPGEGFGDRIESTVRVRSERWR